MQKEVFTFIHSKKSALIVCCSVLMPYLALLTDGFGATQDMGILFFMILLAKLTFGLRYLAFYFLGSLPITYSVLTLDIIMMGVFLALAFGMLTFSIVMLVFDPSSLILTMYLQLFISFGLFMVYDNTPGLFGKELLVLLIATISSLCLHLVLKSKRLRYNL